MFLLFLVFRNRVKWELFHLKTLFHFVPLPQVSTKGYVDYNRHTESVEGFICVNHVISEEEGMTKLQEQKVKICMSKAQDLLLFRKIGPQLF